MSCSLYRFGWIFCPWVSSQTFSHGDPGRITGVVTCPFPTCGLLRPEDAPDWWQRPPQQSPFLPEPIVVTNSPGTYHLDDQPLMTLFFVDGTNSPPWPLIIARTLAGTVPPWDCQPQGEVFLFSTRRPVWLDPFGVHSQIHTFLFSDQLSLIQSLAGI